MHWVSESSPSVHPREGGREVNPISPQESPRRLRAASAAPGSRVVVARGLTTGGVWTCASGVASIPGELLLALLLFSAVSFIHRNHWLSFQQRPRIIRMIVWLLGSSANPLCAAAVKWSRPQQDPAAGLGCDPLRSEGLQRDSCRGTEGSVSPSVPPRSQEWDRLVSERTER